MLFSIQAIIRRFDSDSSIRSGIHELKSGVLSPFTCLLVPAPFPAFLGKQGKFCQRRSSQPRTFSTGENLPFLPMNWEEELALCGRSPGWRARRDLLHHCGELSASVHRSLRLPQGCADPIAQHDQPPSPRNHALCLGQNACAGATAGHIITLIVVIFTRTAHNLCQ